MKNSLPVPEFWWAFCFNRLPGWGALILQYNIGKQTSCLAHSMGEINLTTDSWDGTNIGGVGNWAGITLCPYIWGTWDIGICNRYPMLNIRNIPNKQFFFQLNIMQLPAPLLNSTVCSLCTLCIRLHSISLCMFQVHYMFCWHHWPLLKQLF